MTLEVYSVKRNRVYVRKFDHDEARRRYAAGGVSHAQLAADYGVSSAAIGRVVNPRTRARMDANSRRFLKDHRIACFGGCGRLVWMHMPNRTGYCKQCLSEKQRQARDLNPRHGTETEYSRGCRCNLCRKAMSDAKRERRHKTRVPCTHGCGTLVDSINVRTPTKPPECLPCALKRIHAEQRRERIAA